ncbi:MAG: RNA polymerase sigma factor [Solirubrobacterales bacterium]
MIDKNPAQALRRSTREPEVFAEFYKGHFERVLAYLARRVCDADLALELTAETFAQAYLSRGRFRGSTAEEAEAWIYRIARRQLARYFRRGDAGRRAMKRLRLELPPIDADRRSEVEELADLEGLRSALRAELRRVPRSQREALWLRVVEEHSYAEVAERLGISEQAARTRVSRGLKSLAVALGGNPTFEEVRA